MAGRMKRLTPRERGSVFRTRGGCNLSSKQQMCVTGDMQAVFQAAIVRNRRYVTARALGETTGGRRRGRRHGDPGGRRLKSRERAVVYFSRYGTAGL